MQSVGMSDHVKTLEGYVSFFHVFSVATSKKGERLRKLVIVRKKRRFQSSLQGELVVTP